MVYTIECPPRQEEVKRDLGLPGRPYKYTANSESDSARRLSDNANMPHSPQSLENWSFPRQLSPSSVMRQSDLTLPPLRNPLPTTRNGLRPELGVDIPVSDCERLHCRTRHADPQYHLPRMIEASVQSRDQPQRASHAQLSPYSMNEWQSPKLECLQPRPTLSRNNSDSLFHRGSLSSGGHRSSLSGSGLGSSTSAVRSPYWQYVNWGSAESSARPGFTPLLHGLPPPLPSPHAHGSYGDPRSGSFSTRSDADPFTRRVSHISPTNGSHAAHPLNMQPKTIYPTSTGTESLESMSQRFGEGLSSLRESTGFGLRPYQTYQVNENAEKYEASSILTALKGSKSPHVITPPNSGSLDSQELATAEPPPKKRKTIASLGKLIATPRTSGKASTRPAIEYEHPGRISPNEWKDLCIAEGNLDCGMSLRAKEDGSDQSYRKVVSHFFGRNKKCTVKIHRYAWSSLCRRHYQRTRYRTHCTIPVTAAIMIQTFRRLEQYRPGMRYNFTFTPKMKTWYSDAAIAVAGGGELPERDNGSLDENMQLTRRQYEWLSENLWPLQGYQLTYEQSLQVCELIEEAYKADIMTWFPLVEFLPDIPSMEESLDRLLSEDRASGVNRIIVRAPMQDTQQSYISNAGPSRGANTNDDDESETDEEPTSANIEQNNNRLMSPRITKRLRRDSHEDGEFSAKRTKHDSA